MPSVPRSLKTDAIIADAVIVGLADAVRAMRDAMDRGRARA